MFNYYEKLYRVILNFKSTSFTASDLYPGLLKRLGF